MDKLFDDDSSQQLYSLPELRDVVYRLLKYAVSDANRDVDSEIINGVVPLLQKQISQFTVEDEKILWNMYNRLSCMVFPATHESLWLKEQIEHSDRCRNSNKTLQDDLLSHKALWFFNLRHLLVSCAVFSIIFFLLQSYTVILSDSLKQVDHYYAELMKVDEQMLAAKHARPELDLCQSPQRELSAQQDQFLLTIDNHYRVMQRLSRYFWGYFYASDTLNYYLEKPQQCQANARQVLFPLSAEFSGLSLENREQHARAERATFFEGAKSNLRLCNYLVLPLVVGVLGSFAYVIRSVLEGISKASLTFDSIRRGHMRVLLGGLLGLMSGVIIAPDIKEINEISYTPLLWAFLMGYSVEFAFTFFDFLIARGRNALQAAKGATVPSKDTPTETKPPEASLH